jgi:hypothetical protein
MIALRFQFSILTMLVCTAALAIALAVSKAVPMSGPLVVRDNVGGVIVNEVYATRPASNPVLLMRMAWAGPLAVVASLCLLWASRRIVNFMRGRV